MNEDLSHWEFHKGDTMLASMDLHFSLYNIGYLFFKNFTPAPAYETYDTLFKDFQTVTQYSNQFDLDNDEYWEASTFFDQHIYPLGLKLINMNPGQVITPTWIEFRDNGIAFIIYRPESKG
jgi:hypothetical protein